MTSHPPVSPLVTATRAHVPPRGKAAQVGTAPRAVLDLPLNKKAGDPGISPPAPGLCFCPPCQRVNSSTCQLVLPSGPRVNLPTGQLVPSRLVNRASGPRGHALASSASRPPPILSATSRSSYASRCFCPPDPAGAGRTQPSPPRWRPLLFRCRSRCRSCAG